jgi:signal transduction histidine kinase
MNISDFIENEVGSIVEEWVQFARTRVPASQALTREELADHAKVLLLALAADIRNVQGAQEKHDKSRGNVPGNAPPVTRAARDHAMQRFDQGFSLNHLVSEFRALRASVIRRWMQRIEVAGRAELEDLTRYGEAMDQALSESASLYARRVDDSRNLLLGVLGHDLRTPLGVVHMSASYLLRGDALDGAQSKSVARILTASERMATMVKDLLDFTQTAFGVSLPVSPAPADLGAIAQNIVGEVKALVPECRVELRCQGELEGQWDAARIGQLLSNLLVNAAQHGDRTQPVLAEVIGEDQEVILEIHNKGKPISEQAQKTLFLPLRQAATAEGERRAGSSGLGLGLYIAHEIALAHGGDVQVSSDEAGTTFRVRLPRVAPARPSGETRVRSRHDA